MEEGSKEPQIEGASKGQGMEEGSKEPQIAGAGKGQEMGEGSKKPQIQGAGKEQEKEEGSQEKEIIELLDDTDIERSSSGQSIVNFLEIPTSEGEGGGDQEEEDLKKGGGLEADPVVEWELEKLQKDPPAYVEEVVDELDRSTNRTNQEGCLAGDEKEEEEGRKGEKKEDRREGEEEPTLMAQVESRANYTVRQARRNPGSVILKLGQSKPLIIFGQIFV